MEFEDKIKLTMFSLILVSIILIEVLFIFQKNWFNLILSFFTLILVFLPSIFNRKLTIDYPNLILIIVLIYLFLSVLLGDFQSFFEKYWWWDIMLHTLVGLIVGSVGFLLVLELVQEKASCSNLTPLLIVIFAFAFSVAIGTLWEICEFAVDSLFNTNLQRSSLNDTMLDLIFDMVGALIISLIGYIYLKYPKENLIKRKVEKQKKKSNVDY